MNKNILRQYIDACELIKETEAEISRIKKRRKTIVQDSVKGSMKEFPYAPKSFKVQGIAYTVIANPEVLEREEELLESQKQEAAEIKLQVEAWMNTVPQRMQRIIRYRIFEGMTWEQVACRMGRNATGEGIRMEYHRFFKEK